MNIIKTESKQREKTDVFFSHEVNMEVNMEEIDQTKDIFEKRERIKKILCEEIRDKTKSKIIKDHKWERKTCIY